MAAAFVQKITGQAAAVDSTTLVFGTNNTAGNFISVANFWYSTDVTAHASGNITDSRNTYALDVSGTAASTAHAGLWSALNIGAGANTVTVNPPGNDTYISCVASEYSGVATTSALDRTASNSGNSTTPTSGTTATTTQAAELVIACLSHNGSAATGIDLPSGYTNRYIQQNNSTYQPGSADELIVASTGAQSASWGTTASNNWFGVIATYKAAAGGGAQVNARNGIALSGITAINGIAKTGISAINGRTI